MYSLEDWIKYNSTWKAFIFDLLLEYDKLDNQLDLRFNAFRLAFNEWLEYRFNAIQ